MGAIVTQSAKESALQNPASPHKYCVFGVIADG
jgi:hypothetical protein